MCMVGIYKFTSKILALFHFLIIAFIHSKMQVYLKHYGKLVIKNNIQKIHYGGKLPFIYNRGAAISNKTFTHLKCVVK